MLKRGRTYDVHPAWELIKRRYLRAVHITRGSARSVDGPLFCVLRCWFHKMEVVRGRLGRSNNGIWEIFQVSYVCSLFD